jgi:putative redox protein
MPKPPSHVVATWRGGHAFDAGRPGGPAITIDGDAALGPSPVDTLLIALAGCTGYDIVDILEKRRTPVRSLRIEVHGDRFDGVPGRLTAIRLDFHLAGAGIDRTHAERAIELAVHKYCSVKDSLDAAMPVAWTLTLEA